MDERERTTDVVVIGGGVAGLAAAAKLARAHQRVALVEARRRIGGRILTVREAGWPQPLELGAEFVHSGNPALWRWLRQAGMKPEPVDAMEWLCRGGSRTPAPDGWDRVNAVMERIGRSFRGSFADWLTRKGEELPAEDRLLATAFVQGFQGAPPERMSAHTLYLASRQDEEQFRVRGGYDMLVRAMHDDAVRRGVDLRLDWPVTGIRWSAHRVRVIGPAGEICAAAAIVTVPVGVLLAHPGQIGAIAFDPPLAAKRRTLEQLESGHARRLLLRLRGDIWTRGPVPRELRAGSGHRFGFLQSGEPAFPVWWAEAPSPILVGWTGGPAAAKMAALPEKEIFRQGVTTLAGLFCTRRAVLERSILDWRTYDWAADPYTRGAYSYATAGAEKAPAQLGRPVRGTLFFAGEATADPLELGTVHGAIESGERAAREVLAG